MNVIDINGNTPLHLAMGKSLEMDMDDMVSVLKDSLFFFTREFLLGGSGGVVNSLDFCPASLKFLG